MANKIFALLLTFTLFNHISVGQNGSHANQIKAIYIYNFGKYFEWEKSPKENEFSIGFLGLKSKDLMTETKKKWEGKNYMKGVPYKIVFFNSIAELKPCNMLYFNADEINIDDVFQKVNGTGTLIISENLKSFKKAMLTFIEINGKQKFSLNKINIEKQGIRIAESLLQLAILKEEEWESAFDKLKKSVQSNDSNNIILSKEDALEVMDKIDKQLKKLNEHKSEIWRQEDEINLQKQKISKQLQTQLEQEEKLKLKISQNKTQQEELNRRSEENKIQEENIKKQSKVLSKQLGQINAQKTVIYLSAVLFLIVVGVSFYVYRSFKQKQKANALLTSQKIQIETQKNKVEEAYEELHQQNEEIAAQRDEIEKQKHKVEEHQQEIIDSLNYAKRLQQAILPPLNHIQQFIPETFILYKPKDIVAGDFYWFEEKGDFIYLAAADCTGHGVPGAMVSVVCSNALNRALTEFDKKDTGTLLDKVRELVVSTFEKSGEEVKDGMDISIIRVNKISREIQWSGANNPLWYIPFFIARNEAISQNEQIASPVALPRNDGSVLNEIKADKQPIGKYAEEKPFVSNTLTLPRGEGQGGATLYLFTDGYADQFGGPKGKKFKYKQFEELLVEIHTKPMNEQAAILDRKFMEWKGSLEQIDDVCVIGVKI